MTKIGDPVGIVPIFLGDPPPPIYLFIILKGESSCSEWQSGTLSAHLLLRSTPLLLELYDTLALWLCSQDGPSNATLLKNKNKPKFAPV